MVDQTATRPRRQPGEATGLEVEAKHGKTHTWVRTKTLPLTTTTTAKRKGEKGLDSSSFCQPQLQRNMAENFLLYDVWPPQINWIACPVAQTRRGSRGPTDMKSCKGAAPRVYGSFRNRSRASRLASSSVLLRRKLKIILSYVLYIVSQRCHDKLSSSHAECLG